VLDGIFETAASRALHFRPVASIMGFQKVAKDYLNLVEQPRFVWTFEMDLHPMGESF
jgi:hypothetical protein